MSLTNTISNGFVFWVYSSFGRYGFIYSSGALEVLTSSTMFVSIQRQIFCKLNMLLSLNGSALFRPSQSLQMDAEALRQLKVKRNTHKPTNRRLVKSAVMVLQGNCQCFEKVAGLNERITTIMSTFPSFNCLTNVVL